MGLEEDKLSHHSEEVYWFNCERREGELAIVPIIGMEFYNYNLTSYPGNRSLPCG